MTDGLSDRIRRLVDQARPVDLDEVMARRPARRRRAPRLLAAGAVVVVLLAAAVALLRVGGDDAGPSVTDGPTTVPSTTGPATTVPAPDSGPDVFAGVTEDGRLVVVDVATGEELRELARMGDPTLPRDDTDGPGPNVIDSVDVVAGRPAQVVYSDCCEPAVGNIYAVGIDGSPTTYPLGRDTDEEPWLSYGYHPDVRSDGQVVAGAPPGAVSTFPINDPEDRSYVDPEHAGSAAAPTWLPDGVAYEVLGESRSVAVDRGGPIQYFQPPGDGVWTNPLAVHDGLLVVEQCCGELPNEHERAVGRIIDPATGEILRSIPYEGPVLDQDLSAHGHLLVTYADGRVVSLDPETGDSDRFATGFRAASW